MKFVILAILVVLSLAATDYQKMAEEINKKNLKWKAAIPKNLDKLRSSINPHLRFPKNLPIKKSSGLRDNDLPLEYDPRKEIPQCPSFKVAPDQGECSSCYAVLTASAATDRLCKLTNGTVKVTLSPNPIMECCTDCGDGCLGGWPDEGWKYINKEGIPTGTEYGKTGLCQTYPMPKCSHHLENGTYPNCNGIKDTPSCEKKCNDDYSKTYEKDLYYFDEPYLVYFNEKKIRSEIYENGPLTAIMTIYEDFFLYKSGIYTHQSGEKLGGHTMKIIGWGSEMGFPYWIVANSFNEEWGDHGFFRISRGYNECNIEAFNYGALPKLNSTIAGNIRN